MSAAPAHAAASRSLVAWLRGRSLADCIASGRDNILLLRLLAAALVILGHGYVLCAPGMEDLEPARRWLRVIASHLIGVTVFFVISGHLITLSWQRRPELLRFARARALRILPALALCCAVTALVLGPLLSTLPFLRYFGSCSPFAYALGNASLLAPQATLPGVFESNPVTNYVNGSLWTLPIEAAMYILVALCGVLALLRVRWLATMVIACALPVYLWPLPTIVADDFARVLVAAFACGALACLNRDDLPISTPLLLALVAASVLTFGTRIYPYALFGAIVYASLWFAYVSRLPSLDAIGDYSYGVYLWGFPVEQSLLALTPLRQPLVLAMCTLAASLALGALSWHFVEQPSLRFKDQRQRPPAA